MTTSEINDKNQIKKLHRTPNGRVQDTTAGEQFKPRNLESFDPVTQELYRLLPATIHTQDLDRKIETVMRTESRNGGGLSCE
jgi:hypothetical protein